MCEYGGGQLVWLYTLSFFAFFLKTFSSVKPHRVRRDFILKLMVPMKIGKNISDLILIECFKQGFLGT